MTDQEIMEQIKGRPSRLFASRKRKFIAGLPADFRERIAVGELYVDQDEDGRCAIYPTAWKSR